MPLNALHLICIFSTLGLVAYTDEQAVLWMLGKKTILEKRKVEWLHHAIAAGLALLLITGGLLYSRAAPAYLSNPLFIVKMTAIAVLILNTYFIGKMSSVATTNSFSTLSPKQRLQLFVVGGISALGWITAVLAGIFLG